MPRTAVLIGLLCLLHALLVAGQGDSGGILSAPGEPTIVYCTVYFNSISKIDGVEQAFSADFYLELVWVDNRLNMSSDYPIGTIWGPLEEFTNALEQVDATTYNLYTDNDGPSNIEYNDTDVWVHSNQRYTGLFYTKLQLEDFPFDKQALALNIESSLYANYTVQFVLAAGSKDFLPKGFDITEWDVLSHTTKEKEIYYVVFDESYSRLTVCVEVQRLPEYYVNKVVVGVILLVFMSIAVFSLEVDEPDRQMGTLTVFLAIIAFVFVSTDSLPKVAYSTRIDVFMNFSFILVFIIMFIHSVSYVIHKWTDSHHQETEIRQRRATIALEILQTGVSGAAPAESAIATATREAIEATDVEASGKKRRKTLRKLVRELGRVRFVRKLDLISAGVMGLTYTVGLLIIFLRPTGDAEGC